MGKGEKLVKAVFSLARRLSPCVVFLDKINAFFGARISSSESGGAVAHSSPESNLSSPYCTPLQYILKGVNYHTLDRLRKPARLSAAPINSTVLTVPYWRHYGIPRRRCLTERRQTLETISPVLRTADHFHWHLRKMPGLENNTKKDLANYVEIEVAEMEPDDICMMMILSL